MVVRNVKLPPPDAKHADFTELLQNRRSVRHFLSRELSIDEISLLTWSCQGIVGEEGRRTVPSAGGTYPLELYVATEKGLYHYLPKMHELLMMDEKDRRSELADVSLGQGAIATAPAVFIITGTLERATAKFGEQTERYVYMEMGHAAQNLQLAATALGLVSVPIAMFYEIGVHNVLPIGDKEVTGYIIPTGEPIQEDAYMAV